jgi:uncharacterized protein YceK
MRVLLLPMVVLLSACATVPAASSAVSAPCAERVSAANATMCATDWVIWGVDCSEAGSLQKECSARLAKAKAARGDAAVALVELSEVCPSVDTRERDCAL